MDKLDQFLEQVGKNEQPSQKPVLEPKPRLSFFRRNKPAVESAPQRAPQPARPAQHPVQPARMQPTHRTNPAPSRAPIAPQGREELVRVYALGGLEEVGKNMTVFESAQDIVIVDMGLQFPEEDMYGVNYVVPDVSALEGKKKKIRGIVITHGHLDHIGAVQHLLPKLDFPPVYATALTNGLIEKRLEEYHLLGKTKLHTITADDQLRLGKFQISFFRVNHSIPDCVGVVLDTPAGRMVHTGDFKFDFTPADDKPANLARIAEVGGGNVVALFSDSTNATEPGYTVSERVVGNEVDRVIEKAKGRVILATFSSLLGRIDQVIQSSARHDRRVFLSGRSMEENIAIAERLGYIRAPRGLIGKLDHMNGVLDRKVTILTTGSQGEEMSALTRIALGTHPKIKIKPGDTVVLSSNPIIGNEKAVVTVINNLIRLGAKVITNNNLDVHTSGHGKQGDLKLMLSLVRPRYLVPIHGELLMRNAHKDLAIGMGMDEKNVQLIDNGDILEFMGGKMRKSKSKVPVSNIMIDGRGEGEGEGLVQNERRIMSESGVVLVVFRVMESGNLIADPQVTSRGFLYSKESKQLLEDIAQCAKKAYSEGLQKHGKQEARTRQIREDVRRAVGRLVRKKLDREPLVVPLVVKM